MQGSSSFLQAAWEEMCLSESRMKSTNEMKKSSGCAVSTRLPETSLLLRICSAEFGVLGAFIQD